MERGVSPAITEFYNMEVILKEDVAKLGSRGDVVKVAEGYGRNYLIPKKLAIEATAANRAVIEQMKAAAVRRAAREKGDAEALGQQLAPLVLAFTRKSGENDQLFGSVTSADIARELELKGFNIDRRKIQLDEPLKSIGEFSVGIKLHRDVVIPVKVQVQKDAAPETVPAAAPVAEAAETEA
jgi:large subunit ribosomal protein L9